MATGSHRLRPDWWKAWRPSRFLCWHRCQASRCTTAQLIYLPCSSSFTSRLHHLHVNLMLAPFRPLVMLRWWLHPPLPHRHPSQPAASLLILWPTPKWRQVPPLLSCRTFSLVAHSSCSVPQAGSVCPQALSRCVYFNVSHPPQVLVHSSISPCNHAAFSTARPVHYCRSDQRFVLLGDSW
jgi:hypothetical protein